MGFTYTVKGKVLLGDMAQVYGTYVSDSNSTGGVIDAQIDLVIFMKLEHDGAAVLTTQSVVNATFPVAGHAVTIKTPANETGRWIAEGIGQGW